MINWFCAVLVSVVIALALVASIIVLFFERTDNNQGEVHCKTEPFIISEYYTRTEQAALDIMENRDPVDQTIILWWGLDGLRLNEDGTVEWISRKKPSPVQRNVFYQPCQAIIPPPQYDMRQSTQVQIDALMAQNMQLQVQSWQAEQNRQMINALQSYVVQWPGYYARLTDCCSNQTQDKFGLRWWLWPQG